MTLSGNFFELSLEIKQFRNKLKLKIIYKILKIKKSNKIIQNYIEIKLKL